MKITSTKHSFYFLIHPSTSEIGRWQLTRMEGNEPTGHTTWNTQDEAIQTATGGWVRRQIPIGDRTFRIQS